MSTAMGLDVHLPLVIGFLLFYIHNISVQLAKAGLRHRLQTYLVIDLI